MNYRLTHTLVGIVATALVVATLGFSFVITGFVRAGGESHVRQAAIPPIAHPVNESMADCDRCHTPDQEGMPRSHALYNVDTCLTCHHVASVSELEQGRATSTAAPAATQSPVAATPAAAGPVPTGQSGEESSQVQAGPVPHPIVAPYDDCVGCHAIGGNLSMPESHASYTNATCTNCHRPTQ
jgi:hypothetical protein